MQNTMRRLFESAFVSRVKRRMPILTGRLPLSTVAGADLVTVDSFRHADHLEGHRKASRQRPVLHTAVDGYEVVIPA